MLLEVRGLYKQFGGLVALNNLTFQINEGELLGIIGPNGAGKSTLFNVITGVFAPDQGDIVFQGKSIGGMPDYEVSRCGIARTFQTTRVFADRNVLDNIMIGLMSKMSHGISAAFFRRSRKDAQRLTRECEDLLNLVGLEKKGGILAGELKQEEQKRLAIGIAMATGPKLLLLDEPTGGINIDEINFLIDVIRKLWKSGTTICLIEHKMKVIMDLCERIIVLNYGEKIAEGIPQEVRKDEKAIKAYLGDDYADRD